MIPPETTSEPLDLDRLAYAVSVAETSGCTAGLALTYNNCHGILKKDHTPVTFSSFAASTAAFKDLWSRLYGGKFPDSEAAIRYTGGDHADQWLSIVTQIYYRK